MRKIFWITSIWLFASPIAAQAADQGTYRPGQAYSSAIVSSYGFCASQCQGDAQCKGWNFVRVKPNSPNGVCELNASFARPVASPISISGDNSTARASNRLVSTGSRTIRVGAPPVNHAASNTVRVGQVPSQRTTPSVAPQPRHQSASYKTPQAAIAQAPPQRQIRRSAETAARPAFRHSLDGGAPNPRVPQQEVRPPSRQSTQSGTLRYNLDDATMVQGQPRQQQAAVRPPAPPTPQSLQAQRLQELIAARAAAGQSGSSEPPMPPGRQAANASSTPPKRALGPIANIPAEKVQQSLFGSLYDDVAVPKPLKAEDIPADQDAPIATVSRRTINSDTLMAGAPPASPAEQP